MVGIQGLPGVPEPKPDRTTSLRGRKNEEAGKATASKDGLAISSEAQAAASVARTIQEAAGQDDIRTDRVEAAKANLARGDYKDPQVVRQVAERLLKYVT